MARAGGRAGERAGRGARLLLPRRRLRLGRERRGEGGARVEQRVERREQLRRAGSRRRPRRGGGWVERLRPNLGLPLQHKFLDGGPERRVVGGARGDAEAVERLEGGRVGEVAQCHFASASARTGGCSTKMIRAARTCAAHSVRSRSARRSARVAAHALRRAAVAAGAAELRRLRRRRRRRAAAERRRRRRRRRRLRAALDGERRVVHGVGRRRRALGLARRLGGRLGGGRRDGGAPRRAARRGAATSAGSASPQRRVVGHRVVELGRRRAPPVLQVGGGEVAPARAPRRARSPRRRRRRRARRPTSTSTSSALAPRTRRGRAASARRRWPRRGRGRGRRRATPRAPRRRPGSPPRPPPSPPPRAPPRREPARTRASPPCTSRHLGRVGRHALQVVGVGDVVGDRREVDAEVADERAGREGEVVHRCAARDRRGQWRDVRSVRARYARRDDLGWLGLAMTSSAARLRELIANARHERCILLPSCHALSPL